MLLQTFRSGVILALVFGCYGQGPGNFVVIGPGGGGAMFNPTISPHDVNTVLVSCDMTGSYITHDGGQSWRMFNLRGTVKLFAFDPKDPQVIYAETTALWRSQGGGRTWRLLYPNASYVKGLQMNSDHAEETLIAEPDPVGSVTALAIEPDDSRTLYAAASKESATGLFISRDSGQTWRREAGLPEPALHIWVDPRSAREQRTLIIGCAHSIEVKTASGMETRAAPESAAFIELSAGFQDSAALIAWRSSDRGERWRRIAGFNFKWGHGVIPDRLEEDSVYVSTFGGSVWHGSVNGQPKPLDVMTPIPEPGELQ
jgi:hypothetical protein